MYYDRQHPRSCGSLDAVSHRRHETTRSSICVIHSRYTVPEINLSPQALPLARTHIRIFLAYYS